MRLHRGGRNGLLLLLATVLACDGGGGGKGGEDPFGSESPKDPAVASSQAQSALAQCGGTCSADVDAGRAALAQGDLSGALEAYACGGSPEAAFGAGLTTLLSAMESERADRVLGDLGIEPFPAGDLIGPDGYLSRVAARWNGGGSLTLAGDLTGEITLNEGFAAEPYDASFDRGSLSAGGADEALRVHVEVYDYNLIPEGTARSLLYDCSSGSSSATLATELPTLYFNIEDLETGRSFECDVPFSRDVTFCQQEVGSITNEAGGSQIGEEVRLTFDGVGMSCFAFEGAGGEITADITFTGTVTATVSGAVDKSDLHMLVRDTDEYRIGLIPADVTVNDLLAHASALSGDFAKAACLFERAADGSGEVFSVPAGLLGGHDIAIRAGDAKLLGALSAGFAAALQIGGAYASELPLRDVACMLAEGDDESCGPTSEHVTMVNAALATAGVRKDRLAAARMFLTYGLERFRAAVPMMDATTLFPRNGSSAAGWDAMETLAAAFERSLNDGEAALPFVSPSVRMDLRELFTTPPSPSDIALVAIDYEEECDEFDCYSDLDFSPGYFTQLWSPLGLDFQGDYETSEEAESIEDAFDVLSSSLESREVVRGSDF